MQKPMAGTMLNLLCACLLIMTIVRSLAQQATDPNAMAATFAEEKTEHEDILKANAQITTRLNELARIANSDDKIREILLLGKEVSLLLNDLNNAATRQASLLAWLDKIPENREQLPQEQAYRANFRKELDKMGSEQTKLKALLTKRQEQLSIILKRVPPPAFFTTDLGIPMVLVTAGANTFYFSSQPITRQQYQNVLQAWRSSRKEEGELPLLDNPESPMCGINFAQASQFCQALSKLEIGKASFHLPTVNECYHVASRLPTPSIAIWSVSPWMGGNENAELDIQKRFGMQMQTIWDPAHALTEDTAQVFFREVPFATYDNLGIMIAADLQTGTSNRLNRLRRELQNGGK